MEKHADTNLHIQTNVCERQRDHLSLRHRNSFVDVEVEVEEIRTVTYVLL
jgi:hypothetical protein